MISLVVRPSPSRRATYLRVRSSWLMRVNTMRQSAWLAWRLPPGLSRCRVVLPDDAGMGATPQRCANGASLVSRWGLSPAATSKIAAVWIPTPWTSSRWERRGARGVPAADRGGGCRPRAPRRDDPRWRRELGGVGDDVGLAVRTKRRGGPCDMVSVDTAEAFSQVIGCGEAEVADLVQILDPDVATRATSDQQRPDRFHVTICGLRDSRRPARQRSPCRFDRVDRVGLADAAAHLAVGTIDLDHLDPAAAEMPSETGTVGTGAFHANSSDRPEPRDPVVQLGEPDRRRRERLDTQHAAVRVDRRRDVHIQMRIHSARHRARALYDGHRHPFSLKRSRGGTHVREGDRDEHAAVNSELDHPPERGVPSSAHAPVDTHPTNLGAKQVRRTREPR